MRIRHKPWAKPELEACPFYIAEPKACRGQWKQMFPEQKPLRLELGCGKGGFISQEAAANPDYNHIAIDIKNEMLVLAKRKLEAAYAEKHLLLENIRLFICNLMMFSDCFSEEDEIDRIYINFCNPWPREKHKKRRLTHPRQLMQYRKVLKGELWFKTDDDELFEESIAYFKECGFDILFQTYDLAKETQIHSFQTEHEAMFQEMGKKIKFLIARPQAEAAPKSEI